MSVFKNPAFVAVVAGLPSFLLGYIVYRRSVKVDKISEQSGAALGKIEATAQVIEGLNKLIDNLQEDNSNFRASIKDLALKLDVVIAERDALQRELNRMYRKFGENGENGNGIKDV